MLYESSYLKSLAQSRQFGTLEKAINESFSAQYYSNFTGPEEQDEPTFDIFLSHRSVDKEDIFGLYWDLKHMGYNPYVDQLHDSQLDRRNATKATARRIRQRLIGCSCLIYAVSTNSHSSKWMPWEVGFMDGLKGKVALLPITETTQIQASGLQFLDLYPYIDKEESCDPVTGLTSRKPLLWVNRSPMVYNTFDAWLEGKKLIHHY